MPKTSERLDVTAHSPTFSLFMNHASRPSSINTNPNSVLKSIGSAIGFDLNSKSFDPVDAAHTPESVETLAQPSVEQTSQNDDGSMSQIVSASDVISHVDVSPLGEVISLRINPESHPEHAAFVEAELENTIESATQIQQLAKRLGENEKELETRQRQFAKQVSDSHASFAQTVAAQQHQFEQRMSQLQQQASNVRCQQLHLMQLQTDIIKSHDATRVVIESLLTDPSSDTKTIEKFQSLKCQLAGRFDYITRRWEHMAELMKNTRVEQMALGSFDDNVDWTDEAA